MLNRWIYGSSALLVLLNAACQSGGTASTKSKDSSTVQASDHQHFVGEADGHHHDPEKGGGTTYTCPMHPQIVQSAPGNCPICGMGLVAVVKTGAKATEVMLSPSQMQLANITVRPIASGVIGNATVLNARLAIDQNQTDVISSRVAGRIERLYVKETGQPIRKGQVLYEVYSEPLLTDQQEYLLALRQAEELKEPRYEQFRRAAEQKLRLFGMTPEQIATLSRSKQVQTRIPFIAPTSGTVTDVAASEGQYVSEGALLYRLVNLSQLWVEAELYAGEADYVRVGDLVSVEVVGAESAQPLTARVAFINPEYRAGSQVLLMRAVLTNPGGRFQPGQQARVLLQRETKRGLTLPVDAVVRAGQGSVVFIQTAQGTFQPRKVQTGTETDEQVAITNGLTGSEQVATSGAYLLYSELVLKKGINPITADSQEGVKPTLNTEGKVAPLETLVPIRKAEKASYALKQQLTGVYEASLKLTESFISSDPNRAKVEAGGIDKALFRVDVGLLSRASRTDWMRQRNAMTGALKAIETSGNIETQRAAFAQFQDGLYGSIKTFGMRDKPVYRQFCPMARTSQGAYWLSDKKPIRNPYLSEQMLTCGETKEIIP